MPLPHPLPLRACLSLFLYHYLSNSLMLTVSLRLSLFLCSLFLPLLPLLFLTCSLPYFFTPSHPPAFPPSVYLLFHSSAVRATDSDGSQMVDGDKHGDTCMQLHAHTHEHERRPATACMSRDSLSHTHIYTRVVWRWHTPVLTDMNIQLSNAHGVIYILVFQSPPSVSLVGRILLLEHKAIRKQNAGNINENWDFSERLKMKKEGVVEEVGMWCSKEKTPWKICFFFQVLMHTVLWKYMILFVYWLIFVWARDSDTKRKRERVKRAAEREKEERGQFKLMKHFLT